jgi:hypothetical protein
MSVTLQTCCKLAWRGISVLVPLRLEQVASYNLMDSPLLWVLGQYYLLEAQPVIYF